jgi:hypothetical protein
VRTRNKRNGVPKDSIYIGRGSRWGNPFHIGRHGTRAQVISAYWEYLKTRPDLLDALDTLRGHDLLCYCAPLDCHGDCLILMAEASPAERDEFLQQTWDEICLT